jgi:hypothetical protein
MSDISAELQDLLEQLHVDVQKAIENQVIAQLEDEFECDLLSPSCVHQPIRWLLICLNCGESKAGCQICKDLTEHAVANGLISDCSTTCCGLVGLWSDLWEFIPAAVC